MSTAVSGSESNKRERIRPQAYSRAQRAGLPVFRTAAILVWCYLVTVLLYGATIGPIRFGGAVTAGVLVAGSIVIARIVGTLSRQEDRPAWPLDAGLVMLGLLAVVLTADLVFTMADNVRRQRAEAVISRESRESDSQLWHGEIFPRPYFPTRRNVMLFKPNVHVEGETYGEYYSPAMRRSRTLMDSVLELRHISYSIGPYGTREVASLGQSRLFALGDSFVMGYATEEGKVWTDVLGTTLGEPVFNLGISSTGPRQQLELLKYFLTAHSDSARPTHVLWMLFEGNDLENDYAELHEVARPAGGVRAMLDGTIVQAMARLPRELRNESLLSRLIHGELRAASSSGTLLGGRTEVDGVTLTTPLYHSKRWGYRLFSPPDVEHATKSRDYVLNHPHRVLLDSTFREMRALSEQHGFRVTVIVAPSDARVYGKDFDGFPKLSDRAYFTEYAIQLAQQEGFAAVDLLPLLRPFAERELLYYRDDHHWNVRGNAVVAGIIEQVLKPN
jgi:hypothetical protein